MSASSVAYYALKRLAALGIDRAFGVPGDYTFPVDDAIAEAGLNWILCANELNAAYAADGYARITGAAILTTTYGVGELSALNGVMGAKAHRVPIFHLVGRPALRIQRARLVTHHGLGQPIYDMFDPLSGAAACVTAHLTPENAVREMDRVISEALRQSAPAYISFAQDLALMPVLDAERPPLTPARLHGGSTPRELQAAVSAIAQRVNEAREPVILPTMALRRHAALPALRRVLDHSRIPFAALPMDKGLVSEAHPLFLGTYTGASSAPTLRERVENADLILELGEVVMVDLNTGLWTARINPERSIVVGDDYVMVGGRVFTEVTLPDVLAGLSELLTPRPDLAVIPPPTPAAPSGAPGDSISSAAFYPRLQAMLRPGDILVAETGSVSFATAKLNLPADVGFEGQTLWGSIGWATPAAMGIAMAQKEGRTVLVTGDGAHQMTINELGTMSRYGTKPIIFVMNNDIYGIEYNLSRVGDTFNQLPKWRYADLPAAMGCENWFTARVQTLGELDEAIATINRQDRAAYIQVVIPAAESQPFKAAVIDQLDRTETPAPLL
jgi:indolepyruvate decarboxylase